MKIAARICGVLSVLFLGVCIAACAARSEKRATKDKEKVGKAKAAEKIDVKEKIDEKKSDEKKSE